MLEMNIQKTPRECYGLPQKAQNREKEGNFEMEF